MTETASLLLHLPNASLLNMCSSAVARPRCQQKCCLWFFQPVPQSTRWMIKDGTLLRLVQMISTLNSRILCIICH